MTPHEPAVPEYRIPFWNYADLAFFVSLGFPALLISAFIVRGFGGALQLGKPFQGLLAQLIWYGMIFGALYGLLRLRYNEPFWRSLGWKILPFPGSIIPFLAGPALALSLGYIGYVLKAPEIKLPFEQMLEDRPTTILFAVFVVILGPLCEELAFRGFLMPLLVRSLGAVPGILATSLLFGGVHAYEYAWSWRHVLLISTAGMVFGWVRYRTGSTAAAAFLHSTYNLTQFAAFMAQARAS
jgi:membrane protease YdiL (CAAX protease family)